MQIMPNREFLARLSRRRRAELRPGVLRGRRRKALAAALLAVVLAGGALTSATPALASNRAPSARFEISFMTSTIDHHYLAIQMGRLCLKKATSAPPSSDATLRSTCSSIIETQTKQIKQMQGWLKSWYGVRKSPALPAGGSDFLSSLRSVSGERFDVLVSREFILHHAELLPRAATCTSQARHRPLKALCSSMFVTQSKEIATYNRILANHGLAA